MKRRNKFFNRSVTIDGIKFDSGREGERYSELKLLQRGLLIRELECHPVFDIVVNGKLVCRYEADFRYFDVERRERIVEDVKCKYTRTAEYMLKKKLMRIVNGIYIVEIF